MDLDELLDEELNNIDIDEVEKVDNIDEKLMELIESEDINEEEERKDENQSSSSSSMSQQPNDQPSQLNLNSLPISDEMKVTFQEMILQHQSPSEIENDLDDGEEEMFLEGHTLVAQQFMLQVLNEMFIEKKYGENLSQAEMMGIVIEKISELDEMLIDHEKEEESTDQNQNEGIDSTKQQEEEEEYNMDDVKKEEEEEVSFTLPLFQAIALHKAVFDRNITQIYSILHSTAQEGIPDLLLKAHISSLKEKNDDENVNFKENHPSSEKEEEEQIIMTIEETIKLFEVRDFYGNTPLILATKLGYTEIALKLIELGANVDVMSDDNFHLLDEAVLIGDESLIRAIYVRMQQLGWKTWCEKKSYLLEALTTIPDFYLEFTWCFKSKGIFTPLIRSIAPQDTYKIWKKGKKLRMDSTIIGLKSNQPSPSSSTNQTKKKKEIKGQGPFGILRGNISLIFNPTSDDDIDSENDENEEEGIDDILILDREKFTSSSLLQKLCKPSEDQIKKSVKRLKAASKQTLHSFEFSTQNFCFLPNYQKERKRLTFFNKNKKKQPQQPDQDNEEDNEEDEEVQFVERPIECKEIGEQKWNCEKYSASIDVSATLFEKDGINKRKRVEEGENEELTLQQEIEDEDGNLIMKITDMSFEEYFSSQNEFIEKSSSNDQIIKNENENEMKSQKNEKIEEDGKNPSSSSSGAKKEYARTMTSSIYLCPNFPITLDDLLPALEIISMRDELMSKIKNILSSHSIPSSTHFPVLMEIPLILMIRGVMEFTHFELKDDIEDAIFQVADEFYEVENESSSSSSSSSSS